MALTPKQQRFVEEYLTDLNCTQAAIRAGYSKKTANEQGSRLLTNVSVRSAIAEAQAKRSERTEITQDRVLQEIARIAFMDPRKFFRPDGSIRPVNELDDDTAAALSGLDVQESGGGEDELPVITKKVKLADKVAGLTLLARHMGMLNDKLQHSGEIGIRTLAAKMRERAQKG